MYSTNGERGIGGDGRKRGRKGKMTNESVDTDEVRNSELCLNCAYKIDENQQIKLIKTGNVEAEEWNQTIGIPFWLVELKLYPCQNKHQTTSHESSKIFKHQHELFQGKQKKSFDMFEIYFDWLFPFGEYQKMIDLKKSSKQICFRNVGNICFYIEED